MALHIVDVIEFCQVEAIANKISPNAASRWRNFCRIYSKAFSTKYTEVLEMDPEFVITAVFELELDSVDVTDKMEELMDRVYSIEDPNYEAAKEHDLQEFIDQALEEEEERLKKGKPIFIPRKRKQEVKVEKKPEEKPKELPKEGYLNLSYLAKEEEES
jgi:hypothetical protein